MLHRNCGTHLQIEVYDLGGLRVEELDAGGNAVRQHHALLPAQGAQAVAAQQIQEAADAQLH